MKCQRERCRAVIECILKSTPDQLRTVSPADSIADDHARIQVKDYAYIIVFAVCTEAGYGMHSRSVIVIATKKSISFMFIS